MQQIRSAVLEQIRLATYGVEAHVEAIQTSTGMKDKMAQHWIEILITRARSLRAAQPGACPDTISTELLAWLGTQTDQPYNPLLDVECMLFMFTCYASADYLEHHTVLDPSQDILVEILHTILLGLEKYTWYDLHSKWTSQQQDLFAVRLQGTNTNGLKIPPIRAAYMLQYRNNLIGKHFKTIMQTAIFHILDLVSPELFTLVRAMGELGPVLWASSIDNMDEYLVC